MYERTEVSTEVNGPLQYVGNFLTEAAYVLPQNWHPEMRKTFSGLNYFNELPNDTPHLVPMGIGIGLTYGAVIGSWIILLSQLTSR